MKLFSFIKNIFFKIFRKKDEFNDDINYIDKEELKRNNSVQSDCKNTINVLNNRDLEETELYCLENKMETDQNNLITEDNCFKEKTITDDVLSNDESVNIKEDEQDLEIKVEKSKEIISDKEALENINEIVNSKLSVNTDESDNKIILDSITEFDIDEKLIEENNIDIDQNNLISEENSFNNETIINEASNNDESVYLEENEKEEQELEIVLQKNKEIIKVKDTINNNVLEIINEITDSKLFVKYIFEANKYNQIRNFCNSKNITSINELSDKLIIEFCATPGIGVKKISELKDILIEYYMENMQHIKFEYDIYTIDFIFSENQFYRLREFCAKNNISYLNELDNDMLNSFQNEKGVTAAFLRKINDKIISNLKFMQIAKIKTKEKKKKVLIEFNDYWYEKLKENKISDIIKVIKSEEVECSYLLKEINKKNIDEINDIDQKLILDCEKIINETPNIDNIINKSIEQLNDLRSEEILKKRYIKKMTLEECGHAFGLTRERVRQLQKKAENKIYNYLKVQKFDNAIKLLYINQNHCTVDEFDRIFRENNLLEEVIIKNGWFNIKRINDLDRVMIRDDEIDLNNTINNILNRLPSYFKLSSYLKEIKSELKNADISHSNLKEIDELLVNNGFKKYGKYYSKERLTIVNICDILFKDFINEPLRVDDEGCEVLRELAKDVFGYEFHETNRSIEARIRDCKDILLVDKMTFLHINKINVSSALLSEVKKILINELKIRDVVNVETVFKKKEKIWIDNGINSKYMMYSIINYYFGKEFIVGKGNSLDIYLDDKYSSFTREERVIEVLEKNNGSINKKDLLLILGWKSFKLDDTISKSQRIERKDGLVVIKR